MGKNGDGWALLCMGAAGGVRRPLGCSGAARWRRPRLVVNVRNSANPEARAVSRRIGGKRGPRARGTLGNSELLCSQRSASHEIIVRGIAVGASMCRIGHASTRAPGARDATALPVRRSGGSIAAERVSRPWSNRRERMGNSTNPTATPQCVLALQRANRVRGARAALKAQIADGELAVAEVIVTCSDDLASMPVAQLLASQRGWGTVRCQAFLARVPLREDKTIGSLTERQRHAVAWLLGDKASDHTARSLLTSQ